MMTSMRPIKLTMSAFGPYGGLEIIDFDQFREHNIFVVTGKTGSGKTTIFDGICYALYGKASGGDRDGESLRSHFNKGDRLTYVELEFEIRGQKYFIRRVPRQMRPKKSGEGLTEQNPEAEFKGPDGKFVSGVERVNDAIISLLGLNYNQFCQIIMIPQGEFRELLLAESKDREAIFRKIFGTYQFQAIQDILDKKAKELKTVLNDLEQRQKIYIKSIDCGGVENLSSLVNAENINVNGVREELESFIIKDESQEKVLEGDIAKLDGELDKLNRDLTFGMEINNRFKEEEEAKKHKISLEEKIETYKEEELKLQKGRKALNIKATEDNCKKRWQAMKQNQEEVIKAQKALETAKAGLVTAQENISSEEAKEPKRQELTESLAILKKDRDKVIEYDRKKSELKDKENILKQKEEQKNQCAITIEKLNKNIDKWLTELEKSQKAAIEYANCSVEIGKRQEKYSKLDKLEKEFWDLREITTKYHKEKNRFEQIEVLYKKAKLTYEEMEELFLKGQAGLLAKGLKEGAPCPVCGALNHPRPAHIIQGTPTEEELKQAKEDFSSKDKEHKESLNMLTELSTKEKAQKASIEKLRDELCHSLEDMPGLDDKGIENYLKKIMKTERTQIELLKSKIGELEELKNLETELKEAIDKAKERLKQEEDSYEKIKQEHIELCARINGLKELIEKMTKELPEGVETVYALENLISNKEKEYGIMEESLKKAREAFRNAEIFHAMSQTALSEKNKALDLTKKEYEEALDKLDEDILKAGFEGREDYKLSRMEESAIEALERGIKSFNEELKSAQDRHEKAAKEISGLKIVDILELKNKVNEKKQAKEILEGQKMRLFARLEKNRDIRQNLDKVKTMINKQEEVYGKISHLANMAKGSNSEKLSFERYVLAAYFDDIIEAANMRLKPMTDGRFELSRIQEKQKGSAQQGLDLEVYDYYTGLPRHVKVISGGESFKASLSLALGLSDVVSANAGGISIDTMFIDEGFGTLDSESLEKSIQCLLELQQSGKLVGVISHVEELKERIRARIEISSGITGSSAKVIVV